MEEVSLLNKLDKVRPYEVNRG